MLSRMVWPWAFERHWGDRQVVKRPMKAEVDRRKHERRKRVGNSIEFFFKIIKICQKTKIMTLNSYLISTYLCTKFFLRHQKMHIQSTQTQNVILQNN